MTSWFTESPTWAYFLLAVAAIVLTFRFFTTRQVKYLYGFPILVVLAFGFWAIDYLVETDREQVERKTKELADAAQLGDLDKLLDLFSTRFSSLSFASRDELLADARKYLRPGQDRAVQFWNLDVKVSPDRRQITSRCSASARGQFGGWTQEPQHLGVVELTFRKDGDGQWRIRQLRVMDTGGTEISIPR
jgi:hypothetical protein